MFLPYSARELSRWCGWDIDKVKQEFVIGRVIDKVLPPRFTSVYDTEGWIVVNIRQDTENYGIVLRRPPVGSYMYFSYIIITTVDYNHNSNRHTTIHTGSGTFPWTVSSKETEKL